MGVYITTIVYLRVLIIQIGSTIILMVVEAQGIHIYLDPPFGCQISAPNGLFLVVKGLKFQTRLEDSGIYLLFA